LYHINDIFELNVPAFNTKLCDLLLKLLVLPVLAASIIEAKPKPHHISMSIALFALSHMLSVINYQDFYNELLLLLFKNNIPSSFLNVLRQPPNRAGPVLAKSSETSPNDISATLLSFLRCKEDNLIGLSLSILQSVFHHSLEGFFSHPELEGERLSMILTEILSTILLAEEELRFFSCFLTCRLFWLLFKSNFSMINKSKLLETAEKARSIHVETICSAIQAKQSEDILSKFEQEWTFIRSLKWNESLDLPLNYILPSLDEANSMIPLQHRRNRTEEDSIRTELRLLLLFRKLGRMMSGNDAAESYPLVQKVDYDVKPGEAYSTNEGILQNRKMIKNLKYIIDDPYLFILATTNYNATVVYVEEVSKYQKIIIFDRPEPNVLVISIGNSKQLVFFFDSTPDWIETKNKLEKRIKDHREKELKVFKEFLNS
jgi:hypothetical protein